MALLTKTMTATLPAALLVVFWWRKRLSWRRDVLPLVPFFLLAAAASLFAAWLERKLIGPEGLKFDLTIIERGLIMSRAVWFCLARLFWPNDLLFGLQWEVNQAMWRQYLFPAAALLLAVVLWLLRRRWRGPLAGLLFFGGTLLSALGFCTVYPLAFSCVADRFQYLASLGVIAVVAAGAALGLQRLGLWRRPSGYALCLALLAILASLTFRQSRLYADAERRYQMILAADPDWWRIRCCHAKLLADRGWIDEAVAQLRYTLKIKPACADAHHRLGIILATHGQINEAIIQYQDALRYKPNLAEAHYNFGYALFQLGRLDEALAEFREALTFNPDLPEAHNNIGTILVGKGRFDEAIEEYREALYLRPDMTGTQRNLDIVRAKRQSVLRLVAAQRESLRMHPADVILLNDTAWLLATNPNASIRNGAEAVELARRAIRLSSGREPAILDTLAAAYAEAGRFAEATQTAQQAIELAAAEGKRSLADKIRGRLDLYQAHKPYYVCPPAG